MVLAITRYDIHPDKAEAYFKWTEGAVKRNLGAPGVLELRAYRTYTGASQIVTAWEFPDMAAYALWIENPEVQKVMAELHTLALNVTTEVWGPSPIVPQPIRAPGR